MQEKVYFNLYKILTSKEALFVRILFFVLLSLTLLLFIDEYSILLRILPLYFLLFIQELFIHKKLEGITPEKTVDTAPDLYDAAFFDIRADLVSSYSSFEIAKAISITKKGKFFIEKINPSAKIIQVDVSKKDLIIKASLLVKALEKKYITILDILAAYILLQEDKAKLLESENLSEKDLLVILYWARKKFNIEEEKTPRFLFHGYGAFDSLVFGWTPQTKNFTSDFTNEVLKLGYEPKAIGRAKEYRFLIESFGRSASSNALLVGDPGVGKTTLAMKFAYDSYRGLLTKTLNKKRIYFLFVDRLLSGAENKGEVESRLNSIFTEVAHAGNIIVFIENIENIFGGGGFNFDISGAIAPYLGSNKVQVLGTTTPQAYKDFISTKPTIQTLFNDINLEEPDNKTATFMLIAEANIRESLSGAMVTYGAVKEIIMSANLYVPELSLPGSGAKLLEDVMVRNFHSGKNIINQSDVNEMIKEKTGVNLSSPTDEERSTLLNLEEVFHKNLIGQDEAVSVISNAVRRLRSGLKKKQGPTASFLFLGPTGVGKTTTAKLLAEDYFGSEEKLIRVDMSEYQTQDAIKKILGEMPGEESFSDSFIDQIYNNPFAVVLLDEFEKAHPRLLDVFLQILDEGFVTNNKGKKISFSNAIIIATSNAGSEFIREKIVTGNEDIKDELIEYILTKGIFKPELINRFDDIVVFRSLSQEQTVKIVELKLTELKEKLAGQFIDISFSDIAIEKTANESFSPVFGARNVQRYIEEKIENLISRLILEEKIKKGGEVFVTVNDSNNFDIEKK